MINDATEKYIQVVEYNTKKKNVNTINLMFTICSTTNKESANYHFVWILLDNAGMNLYKIARADIAEHYSYTT